jgi:hypothetical protein
MSKEALEKAHAALKRMVSYGNTFGHRSSEQNPYEQVCEAIEAIDALAEQPARQPTNCRHCGGADNVICAGQCRLQPAPVQQEPVAWMHVWEDGEKIPMLQGRDDRNQDEPIDVRPLVYGDTSPQPAPRVVDCHATGVCVQSGLRAEQPAQQEQTPLIELGLHELYEFQEATGFDTAAELKAAQRKPLTDEQIAAFRRDIVSQSGVFGSVEWCNLFARAIEAAHGIKEQP